jgi:hypothetical protein
MGYDECTTVDAANPHPGLVIPRQDRGISPAVPPSWLAVGDEDLVSNLKRLDGVDRPHIVNDVA